jgi:hypothetical protein
MTNVKRGWRRLTASLVAVLFLSALLSRGDPAWAELDARSRQIINAASQFLEGTSSARAVLERTGFDVDLHANNPTQFDKLPIITQICQAFEAAYEVSPEEAQRFLAVLARQLAQERAAVKHEPLLGEVMRRDPQALRSRFKKPRSETPPHLDATTREVIAELSLFIDKGGGVSVLTALQRAGLTFDQAFDAHLRASSTTDALERGLALLDARTRREALGHLAEWLGTVYPGVRDLPPRQSTRVRVNSRTHQDPQHAPSAVRHRDLVEARRKQGLGTKFEDLTRGDHTYRHGGIVFGNRVTSEGKITPSQLHIGSDVQVVAGEQRYVLTGAAPEEACVAVHLVRDGNLAAVGLSTIWSDENDQIKAVVLHSALVDTAVGTHLIAADNSAFVAEELVPECVAEAGRFAQFMDVPTTITLSSGEVRVVPTGVSSGPAAHRFVDLVIEDEQTRRLQAATDAFRAHYGLLAALEPAIAELNGFARTLAVVRWVREQGGALPDCALRRDVGTPDYLLVDAKGAQSIDDPVALIMKRLHLRGDEDRWAVTAFVACASGLERNNVRQCVETKAKERCGEIRGDESSVGKCVTSILDRLSAKNLLSQP